MDILIQVTADEVVYPSTALQNTKVMLYRDFNGDYWKFVPNRKAHLRLPFVITPITKEQFEKLREENR